MRKAKLYLETSVWNFYFADDAPEKRDITRDFFSNVRSNAYEIFISEVVLNEIVRADDLKREQLLSLIREFQPVELEITDEATALAKAYLSEKIIPDRKFEDALHVAAAAVYEMDALITWNYRHLANLRKMEKINGLNLLEGYLKRLEIVTPMEVMSDEN